jgi:hypothetical protein
MFREVPELVRKFVFILKKYMTHISLVFDFIIVRRNKRIKFQICL